jgi:L-gulonolactone oxidase
LHQHVGKKTKVKVATRYSHNIPKLVCPKDSNGLLISTKYLNKILKIDVEEKTVTLKSGLTLKQIINEASKKMVWFNPIHHIGMV